ncbi:hypothetical protein HL42_0337 [Trichophyton rubrum]|nr:hypothetical protein HL42_0337 [Trichophyton rubrum]
MDADPVRLEIPPDPGSNFANLIRLAGFRGPPATMLDPTCSIMNSESAYTKCLMVDTARGHEPLLCLNGQANISGDSDI